MCLLEIMSYNLKGKLVNNSQLFGMKCVCIVINIHKYFILINTLILFFLRNIAKDIRI